MTTPILIAKHIRELHFGKNWTWSNLKDNLADVSWEEATTKIHNLNTIAALTYHINYYVTAALGVLQGEPLTAKDKYSYDHPPIQSSDDWNKLLNRIFEEAEEFADLIEQLPDEQLSAIFYDEKHGTYFRNLIGILEHSHYHLGQIAVIKKIIKEEYKK